MADRNPLSRWARPGALSFLAVCWVLLLFSAAVPGGAHEEGAIAPVQPVTVVLVRHAEKAGIPPRDPVLSAEGRARAQALADLLEDAGVTVLLASDRERTFSTLVPLSERLDQEIQQLPATDIEAFAQAAREHPGAVVVIAGHSNTIPDIVRALGGEAEPIPESEYGDLFIVTVPGAGETSVLKLRF